MRVLLRIARTRAFHGLMVFFLEIAVSNPQLKWIQIGQFPQRPYTIVKPWCVSLAWDVPCDEDNILIKRAYYVQRSTQIMIQAREQTRREADRSIVYNAPSSKKCASSVLSFMYLLYSVSINYRATGGYYSLVGFDPWSVALMYMANTKIAILSRPQNPKILVHDRWIQIQHPYLDFCASQSQRTRPMWWWTFVYGSAILSSCMSLLGSPLILSSQMLGLSSDTTLLCNAMSSLFATMQ